MARLRSLFDDELFVRGPDRLQPTPRALELAEPICRALREIGAALGYAQDFDPAAAITLTVAMQEHAAFKLLTKLTAALRSQAPAAKLHALCYRARDDAIALLDSGEADVAVGVPAHSAPGRIFTAPLFEEPFVCILRKDHPAAGAPLDLAAFLALDHILVSPEGDRFGHTDTALAEQGLSRSIAVATCQMYPVPALVAGSDMIATVMEGVVDGSGLRDRLELRASPLQLNPCPYVMSWHRRNDQHPTQRWLRDCIRAVSPTIPAAAA